MQKDCIEADKIRESGTEVTSNKKEKIQMYKYRKTRHNFLYPQ